MDKRVNNVLPKLTAILVLFGLNNLRKENWFLHILNFMQYKVKNISVINVLVIHSP